MLKTPNKRGQWRLHQRRYKLVVFRHSFWNHLLTAALPHRVNTVNVPVPKGVEQGNCFVANLQAFTCSKWLTLVADVDSRVKFPFVKGTVNESSWNIEHSAPGPSDTPLIDRPPAGRPDRASGLARSSKHRQVSPLHMWRKRTRGRFKRMWWRPVWVHRSVAILG